MANLLKYRVWCTTDNKFETVWMDEEDPLPSVCPANTAHGIDAGKTSIISQNKEDEFYVREEDVKTGGHIQFKSFMMDIPATAGWYALDITWPMAINMLRGRLEIAVENEGDIVGLEAYPDTIIGAITANVDADDTVITVQESVVDNAVVGSCIHLDDGTNKDLLGRVVSVDKIALTITMETGAENAFLAATPTYVKMTMTVVDNVNMKFSPRELTLEGGNKSSYVAAGSTLRAKYKNNDGVAKKFWFILEYYY